MRLNKLSDYLKNGVTPETLAAKSNGDFSNMTVRRALAGQNIDKLKAKAIAKRLGVKLEELTNTK